MPSDSGESMATIDKRTRRRKDGTQITTYRARVRTKGIVETASFTRKADAKAWAISQEEAIRTGVYFRDAAAKRHTLEDVIETYFKDKKFAKLKDQRSLRTRISWWRDEYGTLTMDRVTPAVITEGYDRLSRRINPRTGQPITSSTLNRYLDALGSVLTHAQKKRHIIPTNPCHEVERNSDEDGRERFLSHDEISRLLEECRNDKAPFLHPLVVLAIFTGGRQGELLNLQWDNVDLKRKQITFLKTKNGSNRTVALAPTAYDILKAIPHRLRSRLVFPSTNDSNKHVAIQKPWERARRRAGLEDVHFHDLRHTTASYLAMSGASLPDIAAVLGHRTLDMVQRYAHLTDTHTAKAMNTMSDYIEQGAQ